MADVLRMAEKIKNYDCLISLKPYISFYYIEKIICKGTLEKNDYTLLDKMWLFTIIQVMLELMIN